MYNTARQPKPRAAGTAHGQQRTPEQLVRFAEGVRHVLSTTRIQLPGRHPAAQQMPVYSTQHGTYDMLEMIGSYPMLREACECIRYRGETAGISGGTYYTQIQASGINEYLRDTGEAIKKGQYQFKPLKRLEIPKPNGGIRTLDIPTIQDRVVECSMARVLYEWCSPTWSDSSMGFRPGINLMKIMQAVKAMTIAKDRAVWLTTDIADAFGSIPHSTLMEIIAKEVPHTGLQDMIKRWLRADSWTNSNGQSNRGIPQGSPLSPFMLNLYMDKALDQRLDRQNIEFIRYADDLLLACENEEEANQRLESLKTWLQPWGLKLKQEKTLITDTRKDATPYIGFTVQQRNEKLKLDIDIKQHAEHLCEELLRQASIKNDSREFKVKRQDQTCQAKTVIEGWLQHYAPGISDGKLKTLTKAIKSALIALNVQGVQTAWIRDIWKRARDRWDDQWTPRNPRTPRTPPTRVTSSSSSPANRIPFTPTGRYKPAVPSHTHSVTTETSVSPADKAKADSTDESVFSQVHIVAGGEMGSTTSCSYDSSIAPQVHVVADGARVCMTGDETSSHQDATPTVDNTASGFVRKNVQHAALWLFDGSELLPAPVAVLDSSAPRRPGPMDQDWALTIV